jgi:hypothetical protein
LNAGWDDDLLAEEVETLSSLDLDFDLTITGFSIAEIDSLIEARSRRSQTTRPTISWSPRRRDAYGQGMSGYSAPTAWSVATRSTRRWCVS